MKKLSGYKIKIERIYKNGKVAYVILIVVTIAWIIAWIIGIFENIWLGIIGLVTIVGLGLLFIKALTDRLASKKDDKYSKNVEK